MKRREFILNGALAATLPFIPSHLLAQVLANQTSDKERDEAFKLGLIRYTAAGKQLDTINSRNVSAELTPQGKVKLNYPKTKRSVAGDTVCRAWVMNSLMIPLKPEEVEAISTTGLDLPDGGHQFYFYWIDASRPIDAKELRKEWWNLMQNPDTAPYYGSHTEYVILGIKSKNAKPTPQLIEPADIATVSWYPQYLETKHGLKLSENKVYGMTKRVADRPAQELVDKGFHIQSLYADVNNGFVPYNRTWDCYRTDPKGRAEVAYAGTLAPEQLITLDCKGLNCSPDDIISLHKGYSVGLPEGIQVEYQIPESGTFRFNIRNTSKEPKIIAPGNFYANYFKNIEQETEAMYSKAQKGAVFTSQVCESGIPYERVEEMFKRIYQLQVEREGIKSVNESYLVADYFTSLYGYGNEFSFFVDTFDEKRLLMSSSENAKKQKMDAEASLYYRHRAFDYRHRLVGGYVDGIARLLDGRRIYTHIANMEKQYIAMADRKVTTFGWVGFEGAECVVERYAIEQRLPLKDGDFIRGSRLYASFEQMKYEAFFSLLIGDFFLLWDDNVIYGTDIQNFGLAHIGGAADWKNKWQSKGGELVQYNPADPTHQKSIGGKYEWSDSAAPGHNGAFCGAWLYSQIQNRVNKSLQYPRFSYQSKGEKQTGYVHGNDPVKGELGNSEVSRFGVGNAGQFNILNQHEHRKPIVMVGDGTEGKVAIILFPFAGQNETITYNIVHGRTYTISHTGPNLSVYPL
jgi:hypothetical protein